MLKAELISRVFQIFLAGSYFTYLHCLHYVHITHYLHIDTCINMNTLYLATNITFTYTKTQIYHTCYILLAYIAF